jgi:hypothetical protein
VQQRGGQAVVVGDRLDHRGEIPSAAGRIKVSEHVGAGRLAACHVEVATRPPRRGATVFAQNVTGGSEGWNRFSDGS